MSPSLRVMYVCTGNICRSPYAHLRSASLVGAGQFTFSSAGTHGFAGRPMDADMAAVLAEHGVDQDHFASRRLTRSIMDSAELVLTMETAQRNYLLDDWPQTAGHVFTLAQFAETLDRLEPGPLGAELAALAGRNRAFAHRSADIRDPYRKGRVAAFACAEQIDAALARILTRLTGKPVAVPSAKTPPEGVGDSG